MLTLDGFDEAIIGVGGNLGSQQLVMYDAGKIVSILIARDEFTRDEAVEWLELNIKGSYMGEYTPIIVETPETLGVENVHEMLEMVFADIEEEEHGINKLHR